MRYRLSQKSTYDTLSVNSKAKLHNADQDVPTLAKEIQELSSRIPSDSDELIDDELRQQLREKTHKLSLALETPGDTIQRIAYLVIIPLLMAIWFVVFLYTNTVPSSLCKPPLCA